MTETKENGHYRSRMYGRYASVQHPDWLKTDTQAEAPPARAALDRLRGWLPEDREAKCLDLGCGAGHLMLALREAGYRNVRGVDISPESVAIARENGMNVVEADIREFLREERDSYDVICAFDILEHFHKDEVLDLLDLVRQRLHPHGMLLLQTPNAVSPWASHYRYGDLTHELIFTPDCAASLLRLTGFRDIETREVAPFPHGLKSLLRWALWKMIRSGCAIWNLAETGGLCGNVYSRNMLMKGVKA